MDNIYNIHSGRTYSITFLYSAIKISSECSREEENYNKEDLK